MRSRRRQGFTVIELMFTIAIVAILGTISVQELTPQVMLAKRTEAVIGLGALWKSQQVYYLDHGVYASTFAQLTDFDLGGERISANTYKAGRYTYQLTQPWGETSFYCIASAQLDNDPWPDILDIYEFGQ